MYKQCGELNSIFFSLGVCRVFTERRQIYFSNNLKSDIITLTGYYQCNIFSNINTSYLFDTLNSQENLIYKQVQTENVKIKKTSFSFVILLSFQLWNLFFHLENSPDLGLCLVFDLLLLSIMSQCPQTHSRQVYMDFA